MTHVAFTSNRVKTPLQDFWLPSNVENLTYTGELAFAGVGNELVNVITGGQGNDTLDGGGGSDRLIGGMGDDTYIFEQDAIIESADGGYDTQRTNMASAKAAAHVEALIYTGSSSFTGYANSTGTAISGGPSADVLIGGAAADLLNGGVGSDSLTGGGGADVFRFDSVGHGVDRISDFQPGLDLIALKATSFGVVSLAELSFVSGGVPHSINGLATLLYDTTTGGLFFDSNGGDGADKIQIATLGNKAALTLDDFLLV
jgi:Ca2+-binding RTX toxin-like protein